MIVKLLSSEGDLTSASTVGLATVVRVNNTGAAATLTRKDSTGALIGDVTIAANEIIYLEKEASDTLEGGSDFLVVKVAYSN
jgi:hypothetical protein